MMTTKEQERKALEQIRKIVAGLGDDSYIGTALTGCLEDADTNIENDWALSMYDRWQSAEQKFEEAKTALSEVADKLIDEGKRAERAEDMYNTEQGIADDLRAKWHEAEDLARERGETIEGLQDQIIRLKAKLYDLMTAGA